VANKVQIREGKWLSIYGRVLHQHVVAASRSSATSARLPSRVMA
jgi:hypothetical protein